MPKILTHNSSDALVSWAQQSPVSLSETSSLEKALRTPLSNQLQQALADAGQQICQNGTATLIACIAQLQAKSPDVERHFLKTGVDFVAAWALASPMRETELDPNAKRFMEWAEAKSWERFFNATVIGVRVLMTYRRPFDLRSLNDWVMTKASAGASFEQMAKESFSTWQAPADWIPEVDASRHDAAHCRAIIAELLNGEWGKKDLSKRIGISQQYLGLLERGQRSASYGLQLTLELLRGPVKPPVLTPKGK